MEATMGGKAFKEKYSIQKVNKEVARAVIECVNRNTDYNILAIGNTEHVLTENIEETGDVDIAIGADKNELFEKLNSINSFVEIKKVANNVLTVFKYCGNFYQVDFMTTKNLELASWLIKGNPDPSGVKGVMRNLLLSMMLKDTSSFLSREGICSIKFSLSFPGVLKYKCETSETIDEREYDDLRSIRSVLGFPKNERLYPMNTFESVVDYLLLNDIYSYNDLLNRFIDYTEGSWSARAEPEEQEKAIDYIKSKEIRGNS